MIEDAKRSIAFLCPVCRKPVIVERTVFQPVSYTHMTLPTKLEV